VIRFVRQSRRFRRALEGLVTTISKVSLPRLLLMLGGLLVLSTPAAAQDDEEPTGQPPVESGIYLELSGGSSYSQDQQASFDTDFGSASGDVDFLIGFQFGGALGFRTNHLRFELASQFRRQEVETVTLNSIKGGTSGDLDVITGFADVYYDFDLGWPVSPYLGAGIGVARLDMKATESEVAPPPFVIDDVVNEFAWNVMAGISMSIAPGTELFIGYRRVQIFDEATFDATFPGLPNGDFDMDFSTNEFSGGLRYTF
jgi:opacity protein-like surface antigen